MRLVLDTNVLVAAMRSPRGASARLLIAALDGQITAIANVALFMEYEAVMSRPEQLSAAGVSSEHVGKVLDDLAQVMVPVERDLSWRTQLADADDEMVLEAAINGQADVIVTFERGTFETAARRFGIGVMTPAEIWSKVRT